MKENSFQPTDQFRGKASSSSLETRIFDIVITRGKEVGLDDVSIIEINNHPLTLSQGSTCRRGMHLAERQPAWRHAFNADRSDGMTSPARSRSEFYSRKIARIFTRSSRMATRPRGDSVHKGARRNEQTLVASSMNIPRARI